VVLGAGFAGYHCLRRLERRLPAGTAEIIAVNPADYMLYVPLLPEVTAGVLAPRQVAVPLRTRLLAVPGVALQALGFKSVAEASYLRDHILRQLELAEQCDDDDERAARLTFVVVGAGYTGTEVAAQGALLTQRALRHRPRRRGHQARWVLLDLASRVLPGLMPGCQARPSMVQFGLVPEPRLKP